MSRRHFGPGVGGRLKRFTRAGSGASYTKDSLCSVQLTGLFPRDRIKDVRYTVTSHDLFLLLHVWVFCLILSMFHRGQKVTGVTDGCELPSGCWESNQQEQPVFLMAEPSLQLCDMNFKKERKKKERYIFLTIAMCYYVSLERTEGMVLYVSAECLI